MPHAKSHKLVCLATARFADISDQAGRQQ